MKISQSTWDTRVSGGLLLVTKEVLDNMEAQPGNNANISNINATEFAQIG